MATSEHVDTMKPSSMEVSVWRGDRDGGAFSTYTVPRQASQTVLDVVVWIQQNADPTLAYRYACRVGMCGSCAMTVNGRPRWTCRTHVQVVGDDGLEIAPLQNLPVIRDLAVDMAEFFDKWQAAKGVFEPTRTRDEPVEPVQPESPARLAAAAGIECINCAVCYAACDVVAGNPDYLGPAALNRAWTLQNDVRDGGQQVRLAAVTSNGGCQSCHAQQGCVAHCPNELNPTASIAGLKRAAIRAKLGFGG
ncbi:MAG: succinate dehydrogenase/fumarate reductase iron-sulfur subunit [Geminicoccales bacterium]